MFFSTLLPITFNFIPKKADQGKPIAVAKNIYSFAATFMDALVPVALVGLGLAGVYSAIPFSQAASWALIGAGASTAFFSLAVMGVLCRGRINARQRELAKNPHKHSQAPRPNEC